MQSSWYLLHITPPSDKKEPEEEQPERATPETAEEPIKEKIEEEKALSLSMPQVGATLVHFLGKGNSPHSEKDEQDPLWDKIQDEARPAWAPDFLRKGYAVVFKREGLPKLAVKLGIRNPQGLTKEEIERARQRILTFDDVWVAGCVPHYNPIYFPDKDLSVEDWWLATKEGGTATSPYLAPGGVTVAVGPQRLSDVVISMLRTPEGFPRPITDVNEEDDMSEFINPLVPLKPSRPNMDGTTNTNYEAGRSKDNSYGWAGIELFRYAGRA